MDKRDFEDKIVQLQEQIAQSAATSRSQVWYEYAVRSRSTGNMAVALNLFEAITEIQDPFFTANSLVSLLEIYKVLGLKEKEMETYRRLAQLPESARAFVHPLTLGVVYLKLKDSDKAKESYLDAMRLGAAGDPTVIENLSEVLILRGEFEDALSFADRVVSRPEPKHQIIGRLLKGEGLWASGDRKASREEFRWIGQYLLSLGSLPGDFDWDFSDSQQLWSQIDAPDAVLVIQTLQKKVDFATFLSKWPQVSGQ